MNLVAAAIVFSGGLLFRRRNRKRLIYSNLTVSWKKDTPWNHSNSQFACGPVFGQRGKDSSLRGGEENKSLVLLTGNAAEPGNASVRRVYAFGSGWEWICFGCLGGAAARCRQVMDVSGVQGERPRTSTFDSKAVRRTPYFCCRRRRNLSVMGVFC